MRMLSESVNLLGPGKKIYNNLHEVDLLQGVVIDNGAYIKCQFYANPGVWGFDQNPEGTVFLFKENTPAEELLKQLLPKLNKGDVLHIETVPTTDSAHQGYRNRAVPFKKALA